MVRIKYRNIADGNMILNMIVVYIPAFSGHFSVQSCVCHVTVLANAQKSVSNRMLTAVHLKAWVSLLIRLS